MTQIWSVNNQKDDYGMKSQKKHGEQRNQIPEKGSESEKVDMNSANMHSIYLEFICFDIVIQ